jgi:hypothetical protein
MIPLIPSRLVASGLQRSENLRGVSILFSRAGVCIDGAKGMNKSAGVRFSLVIAAGIEVRK